MYFELVCADHAEDFVNLDPQVTKTHTKDYAETVVHVQSSLTIKGTFGRKAESPGA